MDHISKLVYYTELNNKRFAFLIDSLQLPNQEQRIGVAIQLGFKRNVKLHRVEQRYILMKIIESLKKKILKIKRKNMKTQAKILKKPEKKLFEILTKNKIGIYNTN